MRVTLEKILDRDGKSLTEINESAYVNLSTESNITFSKGLVTQRETFFKPFENACKD